MLYIVVHTWKLEDAETMKQRWAMLVVPTMKAVEELEAKGLATLHMNWIATDYSRSWCLWETEDITILEDVFTQLAAAAMPDWDIHSELTPVEQAYPLPV